MKRWFIACLASGISSAYALELSLSDLPPEPQVMTALEQHVLVRNAHSGLQMEQANQQKWNSGNYEFNLRAGSGQRQVINTGQRLKEWDVALERPLRLPEKANIDRDIGTANVTRADFALGDAHHEAGRLLLHLWFVWLREQQQLLLWQQQTINLAQQVEIVDKRVRAGDAPKLELNLAQAAQAQARLALQQAKLREQLAANDMQRQFPAVRLPDSVALTTPSAITEDETIWQTRVFADNHELGMAQAQAQVQTLLAQRSRSEQIPDPTVGLRYSNEMGGNEKVTGIFFTMPIPSGSRSAHASALEQQANIANDQAEFVKQRLHGDIHAAFEQATRSYAIWEEAHEAALAMRNNADMIAKAYRLGEGSLSDTLSGRRMAQDAALIEALAMLDANEARYRLQLDGHQLWAREENQ